MVLDPSGFWDLVGLGGGEPVVQAIYGGAIIGEGAMLAMCARDPTRYLMVLQYLIVYKTAACIAALLALSKMDSPPLGGYLVVGAWAVAGIIPAMVFPWGDARGHLERDHRAGTKGA